MNLDDYLGVFIIVAIIGVIAIITLFIGFFIGVSVVPNCPHHIEEKIIEKPINVTDLDFCLEYVKDSDLFQKRLYNKSWMR